MGPACSALARLPTQTLFPSAAFPYAGHLTQTAPVTFG